MAHGEGCILMQTAERARSRLVIIDHDPHKAKRGPAERSRLLNSSENFPASCPGNRRTIHKRSRIERRVIGRKRALGLRCYSYWACGSAPPRGAARPAPGAGRPRAPPGPAASKRLQAAPRQRTPAPPKTAEIIPHPTRRTATPPPPTRGRRTARPHIRTAPPVESATAALRGRSDAPPRAPRTPVPETARARRAACQGRTGAVAAGRVSGASGRSATLCVCRPRRGERLRPGAHAVPAAAPAPRGARPYTRGGRGSGFLFPTRTCLR